VVFLLVNLPPVQNFNLDFYERGQAALEKGEWKNALNIWLKAKTGFGIDYEADPRIGFAFIDVVTGQNAPEYYEIADEMYFWGLREVDVKKYRDDLQKELDRLKPILIKKEGERLQKLLDQRSDSFSAALAEFWIKQNPYPASSYNGRLLEHWERIQYARESYTLLSNTPYGTDDRGLIYVRYGEPSEIKKRSVSINRVVDPVSGTDIDLANNVSFKAEIWYYRDLSGKSTSYVFGWPGNGGPFGLQPGILSLVPVAGNRIASYYDEQKMISKVFDQNVGNVAQGSGLEADDKTFVLPGHTSISRDGAELMLKYAALEEIGAIDPFYHGLYNLMTRDIIKADYTASDEKFTQTARSNLKLYDSKELSSALLRDRENPPDLTETISEIEHFEVDWQLLRFMDSKFNTIYMMASASSDFQPLIAYATKQQDTYQANEIFQLNTLYEYDKNWNLNREQPHLLPLNSSGHFGTAIYYFGDEAAENNILFSAQYLDKKPNPKENRLHKTLNTFIIASTGMHELKFPDPLELKDKESVQLSDILLADPQPENKKLRVPFVPKLGHSFAIGDTMLVYFEVYNLPEGKDYQIEYMIEGLDKKQRPQKIGRSIILNYTSDAIVSPNWFEVPLSDLKAHDSHRLSLHLKMDGRQWLSRSVEFNVE
jgi:GWxTD domain-containing protein